MKDPKGPDHIPDVTKCTPLFFKCVAAISLNAPLLKKIPFIFLFNKGKILIFQDLKFFLRNYDFSYLYSKLLKIA